MTRQNHPGSVVVALSLSALACSGDMGATPGGAQDNGLGQTQIAQGQVPQASDLTVEGLLNQYDLPLESAPCQKVLCIDAAYGIVPVLADAYGSVFVQVGFSSGIDESTFARAPLNLSVVVDRSGSMEGAKLDSVKTALSRLIDQLGEADRLSIVLFDDRVDVLVEPTMVTSKSTLKTAVAQIAARGATDMASGLRKGSDFVKLHAGQAGVSDRIMVFTDAETNTGDTDQETFIQLATSAAAQNIGITLFGVGTDLNQALVLAISEVRGGNYFFLQDATKIATVFDQDFDFLVTPLAYDLHLTLQPASTFTISAVYGFSSWRSGSTSVDLVIPTVFLSRNHGAVVVRLDPVNRSWPAPPSPLAELGLSYTAASDGNLVSDALESSYPSGAALTDQTIFYSQRGVRKSVALVNEAIAEIRAIQMYDAGNLAGATSLLEQTHGMLLSESSAIEDADLTTEAANVQKLESNMQRYPSSSPSSTGSSSASYQHQGLACRLALGPSTSSPTAVGSAALALLGMLAWRRRRA